MDIQELLKMDISVLKYGGVGLGSAHHYGNIKLYHEKGGDGVLKTVIVCSAMGKTTSVLEDIFEILKAKNEGPNPLADKILPGLLIRLSFDHMKLIEELFFDKKAEALDAKKEVQIYLDCILNEVNNVESFLKHSGSNADWSQQKAIILGYGELLSSVIFSHYFNAHGLNNKWLDSREFIVTKNSIIENDGSFDHANAEVNLDETRKQILNTFSRVFDEYDLVVCQGYIGRDGNTGQNTLIGRNGSDSSASVVGVCLGAKFVGFGKDVKAVMTADPNKNPDAKALYDLSANQYADLYHENGEDGPVRLDSILLLSENNIPAKIIPLSKPFGKQSVIR